MNTLRKSCRVCDSPLFDEKLLQLKNMPSSAQNFPIDKTDKGIDMAVYQCSKCGLVQLACSPVPYYMEVIRASAFSDEMKCFRMDQFEEFVERYKLQNKKIIEIGCGKGEYLSIMNVTGANASGIEYSQDSVDYCLKNGLNVTKDFIHTGVYKLPEAPYDAFFMLSYFEHLPDPIIQLKSIHKNLIPGGIGLIEVPNFDMMIKRNMFSEFITDHLTYFTKSTLTSTLLMNGFDIIECKEIWHDYIISAVIKKRGVTDLHSFKSKQTSLKKDLHNYIKQFNKVAVFGAGHQALALIALTEIGNAIEYVVDDATFKQGKFTPGTHIPIVDRDQLNINRPDAIIIIAGSYSEEVLKSLTHKNLNKAFIKNNKLQVAK
tara:strand:- start:1271 stop:2392 length:1122 start_codon:yes stop_codon:yes gene_type:complete